MIEQLIKESYVKDGNLFPGETQVDAKVYGNFKKLIVGNLGKWHTGKGCFSFPETTDANKLLGKLQAGERPMWKKEREWFATQPDVCNKMFNIVIPLESKGLRILEPSAGRGEIIDEMIIFSPTCKSHHIDCVEIDEGNRVFLRKKGYNIVGHDFLNFKHKKPYDIIYANPPFSVVKEHVNKMLTHLNGFGDLVCVVPSSFKEEYIKESFKHVYFYNCEDGAFRKSGTMVKTKILHVSKRG